MAPIRTLREHDSNIVWDVVGSIRGLEEATRTQDGVEKLSSHLDAKLVKSLVEFWEDEWIA